jgi:DNA-binding transcriptional LysR family regulator
MQSLDVDSVKAFLTVAELKSFTRAAEALGTTQGAVSVKLRRLEERVGERLIERTPRRVRLSARGAAFIDGARELLAAHERAIAGLASGSRRFALGIGAHIAGPEIPALLAGLHASDPMLAIEVRIDTSRHLLDAFDRGALDAAIIRREDDRRDGEVLAQDRFGWFAAPRFRQREGEPLRLAALAAACGVRDTATRALEAAGIAWTDVFVGGSAAVLAAVSAGVAVAALPYRVAPPQAVEVGEMLGLPALQPSDIVLHTSLSDPKSRNALRAIAAAFRGHRSCSPLTAASAGPDAISVAMARAPEY